MPETASPVAAGDVSLVCPVGLSNLLTYCRQCADQYHDELCFEAWIRRIAVRTAIDSVRRRLPEEELLEETLPDMADDEEELREQEEQTLLTVASVRNALEKVPAQARMVLSLYLFEGYDMEEIAQILKLQPSSVRSQYLRGKRRLIALIKNM